jgi:hypothetical protein
MVPVQRHSRRSAVRLRHVVIIGVRRGGTVERAVPRGVDGAWCCVWVRWIGELSVVYAGDEEDKHGGEEV